MEALSDQFPIASPTPPSGSRRVLRFEGIEVLQVAADSFACRVTLTGPENRAFVGEGTSIVTGVPMTAAARATLRAIEAYTNARFTLESIRKTNVGGREIVLVIVSESAQPRRELTGAVVVHGDEPRAAALAVLDATNRWLESHTKQEAA